MCHQLEVSTINVSTVKSVSGQTCQLVKVSNIILSEGYSGVDLHLSITYESGWRLNWPMLCQSSPLLGRTGLGCANHPPLFTSLDGGQTNPTGVNHPPPCMSLAGGQNDLVHADLSPSMYESCWRSNRPGVCLSSSFVYESLWHQQWCEFVTIL